MPRYNLPEMVRQAQRRRKDITFRPVPASPALRMDLDAGMRQIIAVWERAASDLVSLIKGANLTTDDVADDAVAAIDRISSEAGAIVSALVVNLPLLVRRSELRHAGRWAGAVKARTGLDVTQILGRIDDDPIVKAQVKWAADLITNISEESRRKISAIVLRGITNRLPSSDVASEIAREIGLSKRRAKLIAQDQANKISAAFDRVRQNEAGITQYRWRHSGKVNARPDHVVREGRIFNWNKPPADGHPRSQPYCGCVAQAYIPLLDEI